MSREFEVFDALVGLPPEERAAVLERECADDPALRALLLELLVSDEQLKHLTARNAMPALLREIDWSPATLVGSRIGPFRVIAEVGRGGMGAVYKAEREDGKVAQTVAIKLMRRELVDGPALERFRLERRVLAKLDHPNIARLSDAGELADGTPYAVMEFVEGEHLIAFCERRALTLAQRLALFRSVCEAVACAHRSLVVHRDLKSSNILVNAEGVPKLLDFGISKLIEPGEMQATGTLDRFLSPLYAAPEQIRGQQITVACDVYALGSLLYQLLTGAHPVAIEGKTPGEIEAAILHALPTLPSAHPQLASAAASMHLPDARALCRALRGDLDGITLRCLRKEPELRYATVDALIADLDAYRDARPVSARGGSRRYRLRKFVRRNRVAVSASVLVAVALLVGIVGFAWQARIAERRAAELEQVAKFQERMLKQIDATEVGKELVLDLSVKLQQALSQAGVSERERTDRMQAFADLWQQVNATDAARDLINRTMLEPAVKTIDSEFKDQPVVGATLQRALAELYQQFGLYAAGIQLEQQALATRRRLLGEEHPDTLVAINSVGILLNAQGELSEAEPYLREALEKRRRILGEEHPDTLNSLNSLGGLLLNQGKLVEAEQYFREGLEKRRRVLGDEHFDTIIANQNLANLLRLQGKLAEAEPFAREAVEKSRRVLGEDDPITLMMIYSIGGLMASLDRPQDAERYFRELVEKRRRVRGDEHPETLFSINSLCVVLLQQGKLVEADSYCREALDKTRRVLGDAHADTLIAIVGMGALRVAEGRAAEAQVLLAPAEPAIRKGFVGAHLHRIGWFLTVLGRAQTQLGEFADAETKLLEAQRVFAASPSSDPQEVRDANAALSELYLAWQVAEPGKGHDTQAVASGQKRDALGDP
jgi:serine/threonine protein kinase